MKRKTILRIATLLAAVPALLCGPASARVVGAISGYDGINDATLPKLLSQTGLFNNISSKTRTIADGPVAFEVNAPLWSDGSHKTRWVQVPVGKKIAPSDSDHYQFPDSTLFIKNFAFDTVYGDTNTRILHE